MAWSSERDYKLHNHSAPCWACIHCQRRFNVEGSKHSCQIERQGFPEIGHYCAAFLPTPDVRIAAAST